MTKAEAREVLAEFERMSAMLERIERKIDQSLKRLESIERRLAGADPQSTLTDDRPMTSKLVH